MKYISPDGRTTIEIEHPVVGAAMVTQTSKYDGKEETYQTSMLLDQWELDNLTDKMRQLMWTRIFK